VAACKMTGFVYLLRISVSRLTNARSTLYIYSRTVLFDKHEANEMTNIL